MWQTICLCPPGMAEDERDHFLHLYDRFVRPLSAETGHDEALNNIDVGLSFFSLLTRDEVLTVLQERRDFIECAQQSMLLQQTSLHRTDRLLSLLMTDHINTLLEAERAWLECSIRRLHASHHS